MFKFKSVVLKGLLSKILCACLFTLSVGSQVYAADGVIARGVNSHYDSGHTLQSGSDTAAAIVFAPIWVPVSIAALAIVGPPYGIYKAGKGIYKYVKRKREERRQAQEAADFEEYRAAATRMVETLDQLKGSKVENRASIVFEEDEDDVEQCHYTISYNVKLDYTLEEDGSITITLSRIKTKLGIVTPDDSLRCELSDVTLQEQVLLEGGFLKDLYDEGFMNSLEGLTRISEAIDSAVIAKLVELTRDQGVVTHENDADVSDITESTLQSVTVQNW